MRFLLEPAHPGELDLMGLTEFADATRTAGLDGVLLRQSAVVPAPLMLAAAIADRIPDLLLAVEVDLGDRHPFELAEEAAVVDCVCGGRLILITRPAEGALTDYGEALDLVRTALTPRPFRFSGRRWQVPAGLPENEHAVDTHVRLTPAPAQPVLPIWGAGEGRQAAVERALGYLADEDADPGALAVAFDQATERLGPATLGAPRARRHRAAEADELVSELQAGREQFGQDWAVVVADADHTSDLGHRVRPRVQLHWLAPALVEVWEEIR